MMLLSKIMSSSSHTRIDIDHLARLSNLQLTDDEKKKFSAQMEETVEYIKNLRELKTDNVVETASPSGLKDVYFTDGKKNTRGLASARYKVKRIL
jgi:aspartyl-tRNA(Asn)/glutamyl-tRNA(Gln) amidotransferase subunit C